ncbi:N-acetylmuramoyl-L-alanine amidase [Planktotalea sp.]|uniref:N-acetylmuramoyl-L-alanine amidase n=1 Tax=Planktotalea sp. TaxID=2029877 RepID=UPI0025F063A7|nr:N-acetylmuramoyl-L-alanine amidase [Planktotalea sp.]
MIRAALLIILALSLGAGSTGYAQSFTALTRIDAEESRITTRGGVYHVDLSLSQGVPYRVYTLSDPARLAIDFREVDFAGVDPKGLIAGEAPNQLRFGAVRPGWSRLVLDLPSAQIVQNAGLSVDSETGRARLSISLMLADDATFKINSGAPQDAEWDRLKPSALAKIQARSEARLTVVLDPGHGGIDPGASGKGITEAELMLVLAQEVRDALLRSGDFDVVLTRSEDEFVSLERRVQIARLAGADLFVSFHADALASGKANGAAVYTLSKEASNAASAALAERHNRADMLAGVDLSGQDDEIASILMELARLENMPRSQALARGIILGINTEVGHTYKRPIQSAGFSVLKAPDIPSVLIEVGFLSSKDDLSKLTDPKWRGKMVNGIHNGIQAWLLNDAADAELRRK